jgi:tellurite resistance protein TehA-like permease
MLVGVALSAQAVALLFWGRSAYLWVQTAEAAFASMLLVAWRVRFRARAPRATRWPPLAPLASLAAAGAVRNVCELTRATTPVWVSTWLLLSVAWFLLTSAFIWRAQRSPQAGADR